MYFYTHRVSSGDGEEHQHSLQYSYYSGCVCCRDGLAAVVLIASQIYRYNSHNVVFYEDTGTGDKLIQVS